MSAGRITVGQYTARVFVESVHDTMLEFVLDDAAERNGHDIGHYTDQLWKMLNEAKLATPNSLQYDIYGHVSFDVVTEKLEDMPALLVKVEAVVDIWLKRFKIEAMKRNGAAA